MDSLASQIDTSSSQADVTAPDQPASLQNSPPSSKDVSLSSLNQKILSFFVNERKNAHLAGLDTIRGLAVLFVVLHHCWALSNAPILIIPVPFSGFKIGAERFLAGMGLGVDIFFVLSGFLLSLPWHKAYYAGKPAPTKRVYLRRRLLRIVPPYWFMLVMMLFLLTNTTINWYAVASPDGWKSVIAHFLFMQQLFPVTSGGFGGVNGSLWTLTIEMIFYLVLPWFVLLFLGRRWRFSLTFSLLSSLGYLYLVRHSLQPVVDYLRDSVAHYQISEPIIRDFLARQFLATLPEFGLGMTLANFWVYRESASGSRWVSFLITPTLCIIYTLIGIALLSYALYYSALTSVQDVYYYTMRFMAAVSAGLLILGALHGGQSLKAVFGFLPLRIFGITGYSIFLWHMPIIAIIENYPIFAGVTSIARFKEVTELALPVVTVIGILLYLLVEKPFIEHRPEK